MEVKARVSPNGLSVLSRISSSKVCLSIVKLPHSYQSASRTRWISVTASIGCTGFPCTSIPAHGNILSVSARQACSRGHRNLQADLEYASNGASSPHDQRRQEYETYETRPSHFANLTPSPSSGHRNPSKLSFHQYTYIYRQSGWPMAVSALLTICHPAG